MTAIAATDSTRPYRGRRLSWRDFYALRPDLKADNDNEATARKEASLSTASLPHKKEEGAYQPGVQLL